MFDWENAITLHEMHGNRASSRGEGKSHGFARVTSGNWGIFSSDGGDVHSNWSLFSKFRTPVSV